MKQAVFNKTAFIPVEIDMSVLTVSNVTHGFGARQILDDASFRLLKGEHVASLVQMVKVNLRFLISLQANCHLMKEKLNGPIR